MLRWQLKWDEWSISQCKTISSIDGLYHSLILKMKGHVIRNCSLSVILGISIYTTCIIKN